MAGTKPQVHINEDYEKLYGFHMPEHYVFKAKPGLNEDGVKEISWMKSEPAWMLEKRLRAYRCFTVKPMPTWANTALLNSIQFDAIYYYLKPTEKKGDSWEDVPADIKETFDRLGIPEAERKFLAGVSAQYESETVYHSMREDLQKQGVIFLDMDTGLKEQPELIQRYFGTVIPSADNKFAALNTAVWSGGSFIYVPKGVKVAMPLQAYFRINAKNMGQFERTLIIADEGAEVTYIEGCTAPSYSSDSLHSAVVELIALPHAKIRYVTIQNWSKNVYNLVTKRAIAHEAATVEWLDGNLGSKLTMKYPGVYLMGRGARGEVLSVAFASDGQHQDAGAKMVHAAPDTSSVITSKSISKGTGRTSYRGLVKVYPGAVNAKSTVRCDALLLNEASRSDTYPTMEIDEKRVQIGHEATVSKIGDEQLFYAMSRGLSEAEAMMMIVNGFIEPFVKALPLEYSVELNRLVQLEMEGAVG
ncbi:MAG: Fe-S cluster assembly protein SufB [Candidatus Omnitrophica bacterium]|nr:Fe-S cluster assembly protein SufB [Candidatus Omnitrophota bacterium]